MTGQEKLESLIGKVNKHPLGLFAAETLLCTDGEIDPETGLPKKLEFTYREAGWNTVDHPVDGKPYRVADSRGNPLYEAV